jgi:hypothetical protein
MAYSQNLADLYKQIDNLPFSDFKEFSSEEMYRFREILAFADPEDFPEDEFFLVKAFNWHKLHQLDQQRFVLRHKKTDQYLRITINRTLDGEIHKNDVRQVKKHFEIHAVYD